MRVAMYYGNSDVRVEEKPKPDIGRKEILMKVEASGICGSDCLEWYRRHKAPLVLGHEVAGFIDKVGQDIKRYKTGERIAAAHHVACGRCSLCLRGHETVCDTLRRTNFDPGGFSEYVRLPEINVEKGIFRIPESVSFEEATFIEPLACVVRGQKISGFEAGYTVLVIGSGISGLLHIQLAKVRGAKLVVSTDISEYRRHAAEEFGSDVALDADSDVEAALKKLNNGRLADLVILCASAESAIKGALCLAEKGGTVLFFAAAEENCSVPFSVNELFWRNEITLKSSYAGSYNDHLEALELIRRNEIKIKGMITHRLSLEETEKGFKLVAEARESMKVIVYPQK